MIIYFVVFQTYKRMNSHWVENLFPPTFTFECADSKQPENELGPHIFELAAKYQTISTSDVERIEKVYERVCHIKSVHGQSNKSLLG